MHHLYVSSVDMCILESLLSILETNNDKACMMMIIELVG